MNFRYVHNFRSPAPHCQGAFGMITALLRTVILYFLIMTGLRLMGKRQIGELEPSELGADHDDLRPCHRPHAGLWHSAAGRGHPHSDTAFPFHAAQSAIPFESAFPGTDVRHPVHPHPKRQAPAGCHAEKPLHAGRAAGQLGDRAMSPWTRYAGPYWKIPVSSPELGAAAAPHRKSASPPRRTSCPSFSSTMAGSSGEILPAGGTRLGSKRSCGGQDIPPGKFFF